VLPAWVGREVAGRSVEEGQPPLIGFAPGISSLVPRLARIRRPPQPQIVATLAVGLGNPTVLQVDERRQ
jgi:hypothetical protein